MKKLFLSLIALAALASSSIAQGPNPNFNVVSRGVPSVATVTATSSEVLASNSNRRGALIINDGTTKCYLSYNQGAVAVAGSGVALYPNGGAAIIDMTQLYKGSVTAVTSSGTTSLSITEYR